MCEGKGKSVMISKDRTMSIMLMEEDHIRLQIRRRLALDAKVTLNGNTVASVRNGETTLTEGKDYTVSEDRINISAESIWMLWKQALIN